MGDRRQLDLALKAKQGHNRKIPYFAIIQESSLHTPTLKSYFKPIFVSGLYGMKALKAKKATIINLTMAGSYYYFRSLNFGLRHKTKCSPRTKMGDRRPLDLALKAKQGHNCEIPLFCDNSKKFTSYTHPTFQF